MNTKLQKLMEGKNVSAKTLAEYCEVTTQMIYYIQTGKRHPHVKLAKKIGKFFDLTIDEIWDMFYADD